MRLSKFQSKRCSHRRGFAMVIVMVFLAATLMMVAVHQRHLTSALQIETAAARSVEFQQGPVAALAETMDLLVTGLPPNDNYVCGLEINESGSRFFRLTFQRTSSSQWSVTAEEVSNLQGLSLAPRSFSQN